MAEKLSMEKAIIKAVSFHFGMDENELITGKSASQSEVYKRILAIYLIREKTVLSFDLIAEIFGKARSTIRPGYYNVCDKVDIKDRRTIADLNAIEQLINRFMAEKLEIV